MDGFPPAIVPVQKAVAVLSFPPQVQGEDGVPKQDVLHHGLFFVQDRWPHTLLQFRGHCVDVLRHILNVAAAELRCAEAEPLRVQRPPVQPRTAEAHFEGWNIADFSIRWPERRTVVYQILLPDVVRQGNEIVVQDERVADTQDHRRDQPQTPGQGVSPAAPMPPARRPLCLDVPAVVGSGPVVLLPLADSYLLCAHRSASFRLGALDGRWRCGSGAPRCSSGPSWLT